MQYKFDTDSLSHARAALLLYAMYRSRNQNSPLNGLETWERFQSFVRGACLKASTTAEFVQAFCKKAKIDSVKPRYLSTGEPVRMPNTGELIMSPNMEDYRLEILKDNSLLRLFNTESLYLIMLVRERIQREKIYMQEENSDGNTQED